MPNYKDTNNQIHVLDSEEYQYLLPEGCVKISDEEADALRAPSAEQVKESKWSAIKAERDRRTENGGYQVGAHWFHSDQKSRSQQLGLVLLGANIPANLQWKTMDGTFVSMTSALSQQILGAAAASDQSIFAIAETHKAAMETSADPSSYDFTTDWPLIYGEV